MSNRPKPGSESAPAAGRLYELGMSRPHGRKGHVVLSTSVPAVMKDHLVELAQHRGTTLKAEIQAALEKHIYGVTRDERRWYG
jgi:hypothetical protein